MYYKIKRIFYIVLILLLLMVLLNQNSFWPAKQNKSTDQSNDGHRLVVIVPFRDRFDELLVYRFNRGSLANVGYMLAREQSDYIAIHDVDLLPMNQNLSYSYPSRGPYHLSSFQYHPQYNYSKYFGGILLIRNDHFQLVNGMSNRYFGWGLEDDEFYTRIKEANLSVNRPGYLTTDRDNTFVHVHYDRKRDTYKTKEQREISRKRDRSTGLNNLKYTVESKHELIMDGFNCTVYNVEIYCDIKQTPWCLKQKTSSQKWTTTTSLLPTT